MLLFATDGDGVARPAATVLLAEGKVTRDGTATAYVCEARTCELPTTDPDVFARQLAERTPLP